MTDLLPGEIHVTTAQKLAAAETLIHDLCGHEGAEGFSDYTHVALSEFGRMVVTDDLDDALLKRATRAEDALRELAEDFHKKANACAELFRSATTVEDQMRMLGKQVTYNHAAELTELTILRLTSDLETKDPQS